MTGTGGQAPGSVRATIIVAYLFAVVMAGTTLPSPLYPLYQEQVGFQNLMTTVIYAVYATGVLATLLLFGRASDVLGRRPVLLVAVGLSATSAVVFFLDGGVHGGAGLPLLFVGRVLSGLSAGLVTAAATAGMIEQVAERHRARATVAATVVNMLGLGVGPLLAGLLATFAPAPLRLPFVVQFALLVPAVLALLLLVGESVPPERRSGLGDAVRPQRPGVAEPTRAVFVPSAIAAFAAFSVFGLLTAVEPGLLSAVLHERSHAVAGAIAFSMFAGSAIGQVVSSRWEFRISLPTGCLTLVVALGLVAAGLTLPSLPLLAVATIAVGLGHGVTFRAGMAAIASTAPEDRRAETVSAFMVVAYIAISVPVVLVGLLAAATSLLTAALVFTAVVALVALGAVVAIRRVSVAP